MFWDSVLWSDETKLEIFSPMDQQHVWRKKNGAYAEEKPLSTVKYGGALRCSGAALHLLALAPAPCGRQDGFIANSRRKYHAISEEAEALVLLDLPKMIPSISQIPPRFGCRRSPGRY